MLHDAVDLIPDYGFVNNPEIKDRDGNGLPELMVKFERQKVQEILEAGEKIRITIDGELIDSRLFEGVDFIGVIFS